MSDCGHKIPHISGRTQVFPPSDPCGGSVYFTGVDDASIKQGMGIDLSDGVHAYDGHGNEIPFTYSPTEIDKCDVGRHEVTYETEGEGERFQPTFPFDRAVHTTSCGSIRKTVTRIISIVKSLPPRILGIANTLLPIGSYFNPMDGVSGIDDNGNATEVTFEGRYDVQTEKAPIASFESDIVQSVKSLLVTLDPIQDLHGYDKPWVGGARKNKANCADISAPSTSNTAYDVALGSASYVVSFDIVNAVRENLSNTSFLNIVSSGANNYFTGETILKVSDNSTLNSAGANINGRYYCTVSNKAIDSLVFLWRSNSYATLSSGAVKNIMVEVGTTPSAYEPYSNICPISGRTEVQTIVSPTTDAEEGDTYTTTLGQTVYGGSLDVVSGELVVTHGIKTLVGTENFTLSAQTPANPRRFLYNISSWDVLANPTKAIGISSHLQYNIHASTEEAFGTFRLSSTYLTIPDADERFADANAFKSWLTDNPITICYELATPQTYTLTPQEVELLLGDNNVWSDGEVQVTYSRPLGQGATKFDVEGVYQITYHTEDECGNETDAVRVVAISNNRYRTVTYEDGTLIINEDILDQPSNIAQHGEAKYIYEPMLEDGSNYVWTSEPSTLWHESLQTMHSIKRVEIGSHIQPTSTAYWFYTLRYCKEMDLTNLDTSRVTDMTFMFGYVGYNVPRSEAMASLDLSMFDTRNVTKMARMFNHLYGATILDVSSFDTSNVRTVQDMLGMFGYCNLTRTIYASERFVVPSGTDYVFFNDCSMLVGGEGTAYNDQGYTKSENTYARIDNPPEAPGYFTAK